MAHEALPPLQRPRHDFRFVSNVDGTDFAEATRDLEPAETLFICRRRPSTTLETMTNARSARVDAAQRSATARAVAKAFRRRSTNAAEVAKFGIDTANMFGFWTGSAALLDGLGPIGLSTMIAIGPEALPRDARRLPRHGRALPSRGRSDRTCPSSSSPWPSGTVIFSAPRRSA